MKIRGTTVKKLISIAGAFAAIILAACAGASPKASPPPLASTTNSPITLTFWHTQTGVAVKTLDALANDFHTAYPHLTLHGEQKANEGDLRRQGLAAIALNQPPDVVIARERTIAEFARKNALVNLDALMNDGAQGLRAGERSDFFPGLLDAGRLPELQNQIFALPFDATAVVLYYNGDLLKAAKVDAPPRTWDQFGNAARATTRGKVRGWVMPPNAAVMYAFLFSRGGSVLAARDVQTQAQFNDDAGLKALQLIAALTKGGAAYLAENAEVARDDFAQGKTALLFGTTDDLPAIADAMAHANGNRQWGTANVPQNDPSQPVTAIFGMPIALFKPVSSGTSGIADERVRAAWLFARWLTMPEQSARWSRATLSIPVRVSAQNFLVNDLPPHFQRLRAGFGDTLPTGRPLPAVKDAELIDAAMVELWTSVAHGTDPAMALKNAVTRVNRILGQVQ